jgi:hypothetical protein
MARLAFALIGATFVLRLILVVLPELGRDEAAYLYWTWYPRPEYSPLLQIQIFLARLVSDAPWLLRSSQLVVSALTLFFFGQWMRARGQVPCVNVAALACVPWLVFVGGVLHPDGLLVLGLVLFALGVEEGRSWKVAVGASICVGAKLTGLLPAVVAVWWLGSRRDRIPLGFLFVVLVGFALTLRPESIEAAREFARIEAGVFTRIGVLLLEIVLIGGALVLAPRWRRDAVGWTGIALLAGFTVAAIGGGQVKANWLLPGLLLLWSASIARPILLAAAVAGLLVSGAMVSGYAMPSLAREVEIRLDRAGLLPAYSLLAGEREARVASARNWSEYLLGFHATVEWPELPFVPDEIVSDDYGLACKLALACPETVPRVVVPQGPLFRREPGLAPARRLVVAVRSELTVPGRVVWRGELAHPVTGAPVPLLLVEEP